MDLTGVEEHLGVLASRLLRVLLDEPFDASPARAVGADLVAAHFTSSKALERTVAVLQELLCHLPAGADVEAGPTSLHLRLARLTGAFAAGYAQALKERTLEEQEQIRQAALSARDEAERALRATEARFHAVFAGAGIGIGIGDVDGRVLDANQSLVDMLGYTVTQLRHHNVRDFIHPDDGAEVWSAYEELVRGERDHFRVQKQFLRRDGAEVWTHLTVSLIRDDDGSPRYQVAMITDVTDLHRLQTRLEHQALHDPLTALPNRALFLERLNRLFDRPSAATRVGLCFLDLDGFKAINDSLGHIVGDQLLVALADRLKRAVAGAGHLVARIGGDEFVILIENSTSTEEVIAVARQALTALAASVQLDGRELSVTASAGVVERTVRGTDPAEVMRAADITLYWAKSDGKARWAVFDAERNAREVTRYTLAAALPAALEAGEFTLHYQPLVALSDGALRGVEALVRWNHPELGQLSPDQFIGLAEGTGHIVGLGRWVLQTACRQARQWEQTFPDPPFISVNLAVRQLQDGGLVDEVKRVLAETGLAPGRLQLELTESVVMGTDHQSMTTLRALSTAGVRIAIDDFGTGYSNLAYLQHLPVNELKLAASFVQTLHPLPDAVSVEERILATLVSLAHTLGLTVTAEGVETAAAARRLRAIGCDAGQGLHFAPPGPPQHIEALLTARTRP